MNKTYCDLEDFKKSYKDIHGYLSLIVCVFGSMANIFNICVLRTKQMRSPTNFILTGLAVADLLVMLEYIPFTVHRNLSPNQIYATHFTYSWAIFYKFHALFTQVLHFISCCLTVILAVWRYIYISKPRSNNICSNHLKTNIVISLTYLICPLVCFPMYSTLEIKHFPQSCDDRGVMVLKQQRKENNYTNLHNETIFILHPNDPAHLSIWVYSVLLKLLPCILLSVLSYKIISALLDAKRRRIKLLNACSPGEELNGKSKQNAIQLYKENQADRTTRMLLAVLLLFLITEFPQAILGHISAIYGETFLDECYAPLGEVMDILALTNSAINFILYCTMSRQFRVAFQEVFRIKLLKSCLPSTQRIQDENGAETKMSLV